MQQLRSPLGAGMSVRVRAQRWTIGGVESGDRAEAVDLISAEPDAAGRRRTLLAPFDDFQRVDDPSEWRVIREGALVGTLATAIASATPWPAPEVARTAHIDLLPYQLSACLALRTGRARLVLIADPVGSGKTIQAGLALADLRDRHPGARALVLVPAGLREQWRAEMQDRFSLDLREVDGNTWRHEDPSTNSPAPWRLPGVTLASFDYVKRPETINGLDAIRWDLLVIDEAHHAGAGTDRGAAIRALCRRSMAVLLLTATPHDGDEARFQALCRLGRLHPDEPLLLLRRTPDAIDARRARTRHLLRVQASPEEAHARRLLNAYLRALRDASTGPLSGGRGVAGLLAAIFTKRAASSPAALRRTAQRRLALAAPPLRESQPPLPFVSGDEASGTTDDDADDDRVLSLKGPLDWRRERAWLGALADAAGRAALASPKVRALHRLLARLREPVIVFTEYRDTLAWLSRTLPRSITTSCLHGLQTMQERNAELTSFRSGRSRLLLSTDVGAEGLNLQHRCRVVIEFDRPWTPLRSEQRVGRVDRIGQTRRVHTWSLFTEGDADLRIEEATIARRASAVRGLSQHPDLCDAVGSAEQEVHRALVTARGLLRRLPVEVVERSERTLRRAPALVAFVSPRRRHALGLCCDELLVLAEFCLTADGTLVDALAVALRVRIGAPGPRGDPAPTGTSSAPEIAGRRPTGAWFDAIVRDAWRAAAGTCTLRRAHLARALESAHAVEASRARLVDSSLGEHIAAHFAQPDLFGHSLHSRRADETPGGPRRSQPPTVALVTRTTLVVAPRHWAMWRPTTVGAATERGTERGTAHSPGDARHTEEPPTRRRREPERTRE